MKSQQVNFNKSITVRPRPSTITKITTYLHMVHLNCKLCKPMNLIAICKDIQVNNNIAYTLRNQGILTRIKKEGKLWIYAWNGKAPSDELAHNVLNILQQQMFESDQRKKLKRQDGSAVVVSVTQEDDLSDSVLDKILTMLKDMSGKIEHLYTQLK